MRKNLSRIINHHLPLHDHLLLLLLLLLLPLPLNS